MKRSLDPVILAGALLVLAAVLAARLLLGTFPATAALSSLALKFDSPVFFYSTLPRMAIAVLCGSGLAMSGAILQQVLRNPLASPDTLAVSAGARLAMGLATLLAPGLFGLGRDIVAILGAVTSTALVLLIARSRKYSPLSMILAGLVVSMFCGAVSTVLILAKDRYLVGLLIWGSGSLSQQSWEPALQLAVRLVACSVTLLLLMRPLAVLDAGEEVARNVGLPVERVRLLAIGLAVFMAAFVTSTVGVIGFIGLVAPALATFCGVRRFPARCAWSAVMGALLLLVTDLAVQLVGGDGAAFIPTGAVTAVIGSPILFILLAKLRFRDQQQIASETAFLPPGKWQGMTALARGLWCAGLLVGMGLLVLVGRAPDGSWTILPTDMFADVLPWRLPRMLGAAGGGALLAVAGYILQRVTENPLASPEIMGVTAGAILGAAATLYFVGSASGTSIALSTAAGSFAALLFVLAITVRQSVAPERVLLAGVALTALVDALVGVITASGSPSSVLLLSWMAGSASGISFAMAIGVVAAAALMLVVALLGVRWLAILPLGAPTAFSLGVPVSRARSALLALVAVMTAVATPVIGPLTFVGLMAPYAVRLLGIRAVPAGLLFSSLAGASLMILADTLARTVAFPLQLPTGIVGCLLACPVLLLLIALGGKR